MNRRQKIIISVTGIFLVALILMGLTYAYFLTQITGNTKDKSISVQTADLKLTYGDGTTKLLTSTTKLVPSSNPINTKDFTVTNDGDDTTYAVIIENVRAKVAGTENLTTFNSNDFKYTLTCTKSDGTSCNGVSTQTTLPMSDNILVENDIDTGDVHVYVMTVWYLDNGNDQSSDMNKTLEAKINIEDPNRINPYSSNPNSLAFNIINNSLNVANGTSYMKTPLTTPAKGSGNIVYINYIEPNRFIETGGRHDTSNWFVYGSEITMDSDGYFKITDPQVGQYSTVWTNMKNGYTNNYDGYSTEEEAKAVMNNEFSTIYKVGGSTTLTNLCFNSVTKNSINIESVLSQTPDDYTESSGINSYYFRGGVEDNYVNFAGMCWKIVRIEGDGSVKLILEDRNEQCNDKEGNDLNKSGTYYTGNWSDGETYVFGYNNNSEMDFLNYNSADGLLQSFKTFQTLKLASVLDKLKIDEWCYDDNVTDTYTFNDDYYCYDHDEDGVYDWCPTDKHYGAYTRIKTNMKPTLICTGKKLTKFKDKTDMYVATLTADEMSFAGTGKVSNYNYYLINNYARDYELSWWSLSPWTYVDFDYAWKVFSLTYNGDYTPINVISDIFSRPAVTLKPGVEIVSGGIGTQNNPYIIK